MEQHIVPSYSHVLSPAEARQLTAQQTELEIDLLPPKSRFRLREQTVVSEGFRDNSFRLGSSTSRR